MERKDLIRNVLQAARQFNGRRLWKRFTNTDCFGIRIPVQNDALLGVVMGGGGEEYGLSLFRGPAAASCVEALRDPQGPGDNALQDADLLGFSMDRFDRLPAEGRELLREAGLYPRQDESVPSFLAKPPGAGRVFLRVPSWSSCCGFCGVSWQRTCGSGSGRGRSTMNAGYAS